MKKRLICCLIVLVLCLSVFAGCATTFGEDDLVSAIKNLEAHVRPIATNAKESYEVPNELGEDYYVTDSKGNPAKIYVKWSIVGSYQVDLTNNGKTTTVNITAGQEVDYMLNATLVNNRGKAYLNSDKETYTITIICSTRTTTSGGGTTGGNTGGNTGGTTGGNTGGSSGTTGYYVKVTSASQMVSGANYLIVYEDGKVAFDGSLSEDQTYNTQSVTMTSNGIEATSAINAISFTITSVSGGYAIKAASSMYIGSGDSDKNQLLYSADQVVTTISFATSGDVDIVSGGHLRYNATSGQLRFRFYKESTYGNQQPIQLYMLAQQ